MAGSWVYLHVGMYLDCCSRRAKCSQGRWLLGRGGPMPEFSSDGTYTPGDRLLASPCAARAISSRFSKGG